MPTHHFNPNRYYTAIGTYEPVLRIGDGDSVVTTTVDAGGSDASNTRVTPGGNPQTGPFYVEGAEPGDTLAVRFDRLWPNRTQGWTGTYLAPNVVDPEYATELPPIREWGRADWELDLAAGTATLVKPLTRLGKFTVPMRPMLGCFGVAPDRGFSGSNLAHKQEQFLPLIRVVRDLEQSLFVLTGGVGKRRVRCYSKWRLR